jgi:UDP-2-acetamido-2-deoxy-ribo-hexuluronate aminotransferase
MAVPFFSGGRSLERHWPRVRELLDEALDAGRFVNGPLVPRFERAIEEYTGARHAIAVASGSDALVVALEACGVGRGDEVAVPVYTFFASASSVVHVGARPVFVDVLPGSYAIDPRDLEARLTSATNAVMPVHLFTQMADMPAVMDVAGRHGLTVVEDSAEAIGMDFDGTPGGRFGRAGVLSFFPTKTLGALGDAGMVLTDDDGVADRCRRLRNHGQVPGERPYVWDVMGLNSRMDDVQAAVLLARLERLDDDIARRAELAARYDERLRGLVETPAIVDARATPVYYVYLIEAEDRDGLVEHLSAAGIETEVYYPRPLHLQPCFAHMGHGAGDFPVAERAAERAVGLPLYPDMDDSQVDEVCAAIAGFYERGPRRAVESAEGAL